ncbi:RHS repeat-associated core domain-containing protein [Methylocaldum gracile]|jgi:filamentous hemagglutinin|uniref:RHS repeat-associated core domain-containing protein n=1 Tax=Methylocaldum sp. 0917 TaxID=2485163 RepID=UPI00105C91CE
MYYRARYYNPSIGRFTQRDPAGFVDGLNPYAYVGNNPVSFTDPLGLNKVAPMASSNVSGYQGAPSTGSSLLNELRTTASAFLDVARKKPAIGIAAGPAVDVAEGIESGNASQVAFNVATADLPGAKVGIGILGAVIRNSDNVADITKGTTSGAESAANAARLRGQLAGQEIAGGHAFEKHVLQQGEFQGLGIRTREQFAKHIENVINNPTATRQLSGGRLAYWDDATSTVVIRNPRAADGGTAFQPTLGRKYFDDILH